MFLAPLSPLVVVSCEGNGVLGSGCSGRCQREKCCDMPSAPSPSTLDADQSPRVTAPLPRPLFLDAQMNRLPCRGAGRNLDRTSDRTRLSAHGTTAINPPGSTDRHHSSSFLGAGLFQIPHVNEAFQPVSSPSRLSLKSTVLQHVTAFPWLQDGMMLHRGSTPRFAGPRVCDGHWLVSPSLLLGTVLSGRCRYHFPDLLLLVLHLHSEVGLLEPGSCFSLSGELSSGFL